MDQALQILIGNLTSHAESARRRMAMTLEVVSHLTDLPLAEIAAVERGDKVYLDLDELSHLALFLGLTACGEMRPNQFGKN